MARLHTQVISVAELFAQHLAAGDQVQLLIFEGHGEWLIEEAALSEAALRSIADALVRLANDKHWAQWETLQ